MLQSTTYYIPVLCLSVCPGDYSEPNNQQHYGWVPASSGANPSSKKFYQPHNFNRPTPGPLAYKPSKNAYRYDSQPRQVFLYCRSLMLFEIDEKFSEIFSQPNRGAAQRLPTVAQSGCQSWNLGVSFSFTVALPLRHTYSTTHL